MKEKKYAEDFAEILEDIATVESPENRRKEHGHVSYRDKNRTIIIYSQEG